MNYTLSTQCTVSTLVCSSPRRQGPGRQGRGGALWRPPGLESSCDEPGAAPDAALLPLHHQVMSRISTRLQPSAGLSIIVGSSLCVCVQDGAPRGRPDARL